MLSLAACGSNTGTGQDSQASGNTDSRIEGSAVEPEAEAILSKDEMLATASPLTRKEIEKAIDNKAFAKSLIGNVYTFGGEIYSVEEEYAVASFYIKGEESSYATSPLVMVANLYLPVEELISLEAEQRLLFVGRLDDVSTHDESVPDWGTETVVDMIFRSAAITGDRFENTGELFSKNASCGEDAWNVLPRRGPSYGRG